MSEATTTATEGESTATEGEQQQEQTFTQKQLDDIVKDRLTRERAKFADYAELKSKAEGSKTLEERLASLEGELTTANAKALRSDIAAKHGISAEDRDLFLTGSDEETLTAQAERLAAREADRKKHGNVARKEGNTKTTGDRGDEHDFVSELFGNSD